jgi:hypothetical protein
MVNSGEASLNVVTKDKRKLLNRLDQKVRGQDRGAPNSPGADDEPPAKRRDLNHTLTARAKRGKPVALLGWQQLGKANRKASRWGGG